MTASPDILRDFSRLQADAARLSKSNVKLVNELLKAQQERDKARQQYSSTHALAEVLVTSRNQFLEALREIAKMDVSEGARAVWRAKEALK